MGCANGKLEPEAPPNDIVYPTYYGGKHGARTGPNGVAYTNARNQQAQRKGVQPPPEGGQPKTNKKVR